MKISRIFQILQMYQAKLNYLGFENLIEWLTYISALLTVIDVKNCQRDSGYRFVSRIRCLKHIHLCLHTITQRYNNRFYINIVRKLRVNMLHEILASRLEKWFNSKINFHRLMMNILCLAFCRNSHMYCLSVCLLCPPLKKEGHIALHLSVRPSVRLSVGMSVSLNLVQLITQEGFAPEDSNLVGR